MSQRVFILLLCTALCAGRVVEGVHQYEELQRLAHGGNVRARISLAEHKAEVGLASNETDTNATVPMEPSNTTTPEELFNVTTSNRTELVVTFWIHGTLPDFVQETFIKELADNLFVNASQLAVLSVRSGSVILTLSFHGFTVEELYDILEMLDSALEHKEDWIDRLRIFDVKVMSGPPGMPLGSLIEPMGNLTTSANRTLQATAKLQKVTGASGRDIEEPINCVRGEAPAMPVEEEQEKVGELKVMVEDAVEHYAVVMGRDSEHGGLHRVVNGYEVRMGGEASVEFGDTLVLRAPMNAEGWAWLDGVYLQCDTVIEFSIELEDNEHPVRRHGGIMIYATDVSSRWDVPQSGYTIDFFERDHIYRLVRWEHGSFLPQHVIDHRYDTLVPNWKIIVTKFGIVFEGRRKLESAEPDVHFCASEVTMRKGFLGFWASKGQVARFTNLHIYTPTAADLPDFGNLLTVFQPDVISEDDGIMDAQRQEFPIRLAIGSGGVNKTTSHLSLHSCEGSESWVWIEGLDLDGDVELSFRIEINKGHDDFGHAGVMLMASGKNHRYGAGINGYTVDFFDRESMYRFYKWRNGHPISRYHHHWKMPDGTPKRPDAFWRVTVRGEFITFSTSTDPEEALFTVEDNEFRTGHVGFWVWKGDSAEIWDVTVRDPQVQ
eukprot:TRINITY_DN33734_c0_g1_i1.p1 TRINITY_DN33734_c0_g1~~TRINITY_DN33734_c0_g1_i1.p1  ORF type:complete len:669 (-),score=140.85 TRINITY_DN33734_c0_g1_i1:41-2026(-)